jgi:hypothetical protein
MRRSRRRGMADARRRWWLMERAQGRRHSCWSMLVHGCGCGGWCRIKATQILSGVVPGRRSLNSGELFQELVPRNQFNHFVPPRFNNSQPGLRGHSQYGPEIWRGKESRAKSCPKWLGTWLWKLTDAKPTGMYLVGTDEGIVHNIEIGTVCITIYFLISQP